MRTIWIATAGILGASLLFALYMHFAGVGARNQAASGANQQGAGGEQPVLPVESAQPPSPATEQPEQPGTALSTPPPAEGSTPVAAAQPRPAPGQSVIRRQHSSTVRETSASSSEELRASRRENPPQASSDSAAQNERLVSQAALQPPTPPVTPVQSDVAPPPATAPFAKLYVNGNVLVNGHLSGESSLFAGDWVDTPEGTEATVVGENFEAVLKAGSRLSVDQSGIQLARGDVLVTTTAGTSVKTNTVRVTPQTSPNAKFEVFDQTEGVKVMTYQGSVVVQ